jgi:hypothetical protein
MSGKQQFKGKKLLSKGRNFMKRKQFVSVLILAGAFMAINPSLTLSQSVGGSQSERTGGSDQTPVPKGRSSGEEGKAGKGAAKTQPQTNKDTSIGGSKSERTGGGTPMPEGAYSGEESKGKKSSKSQSKTKKDTSVGGSQSERSGSEQQTPMPKDR